MSASSKVAEARTIARLAAPISLAQLAMMALGLVDVAVLGHASPEDLAGAGIGRSVAFVAVGLGLGATNALEPLAAQAVGAGDHRGAFRALLAALAACTVISVPCAALAYASTFALPALGIEPRLVAIGRDFIVPQLPGMLLWCWFFTGKAYLQAHGRTAPALVASLIANVVNLIACNLLVRGDEPLVALGLPALGLPRLGAFGAGLASTIANLVLAAWVLVVVFRMPRPRSDFSLRELPIGKILRLGVPIGFQMLAEIGVFSFVAVIAGRLGTVPVSAHQIAIGLASFTFMGALGVGGATSVRVGHAIGEGRSPRDAGFIGIGLGALFMCACAVALLLFADPLARLFTDDPETRALTSRLLLIAAAFQLFDGVQVVAAGALRGAADVRFSFLTNLAAHWLVGLPLALLFGFRLGWGAPGLWWGLLIGLAAVAVALTARFARVARGTIARF